MVSVFLIACVALAAFVGLLLLLGMQETAARQRRKPARKAEPAPHQGPPGALAS